jgi:Tat protein secretion system quality control protein TatD with DNase activity
VAEELARLRDMPLEELACSTTRNFFTLFQCAHPASPIFSHSL